MNDYSVTCDMSNRLQKIADFLQLSYRYGGNSGESALVVTDQEQFIVIARGDGQVAVKQILA